MNQKSLSSVLKIITVCAAVCFALIFFWIIPIYGRSFAALYPEFEYCYIPCPASRRFFSAGKLPQTSGVTILSLMKAQNISAQYQFLPAPIRHFSLRETSCCFSLI